MPRSSIIGLTFCRSSTPAAAVTAAIPPLPFFAQGGAPNYQPNSFDNAVRDPAFKEHVDFVTGDIERYDANDEDNFSQVADFWNKVRVA